MDNEQGSEDADPVKEQLDHLRGLSTNSIHVHARHHSAIRHLLDRVELLENVLFHFAQVKGDGELLVRLGKRELARQQDPERVPPPWPPSVFPKPVLPDCLKPPEPTDPPE